MENTTENISVLACGANFPQGCGADYTCEATCTPKSMDALTAVITFGSLLVLILMSGMFSGLTLGLMGLDPTMLDIVARAGELHVAHVFQKAQPSQALPSASIRIRELTVPLLRCPNCAPQLPSQMKTAWTTTTTRKSPGTGTANMQKKSNHCAQKGIGCFARSYLAMLLLTLSFLSQWQAFPVQVGLSGV